MSRLCAVGVFTFLAFTPNVFAFSAGAHRIVAEIAWQRMDEEARQRAYGILQEHPRYEHDFLAKMPNNIRKGDNALKARWLLQQAAVWPDTVRGLPTEEKAKYHMGTWHYINFPTYLDESHGEQIDLSRVTVDRMGRRLRRAQDEHHSSDQGQHRWI